VRNAFWVGTWLVRPHLNTVSNDHASVRLEPKMMDVLVCLVASAGEPVSKDVILRTVWSGTFVSDDVLTRSISELRRVFEDDPRKPRFIETIPKRGYRLVASVTAANEGGIAGRIGPAAIVEVATEKRRGTWTRWGAILAVCVVVLLPLALHYRRSGQPEGKSSPELTSLQVVAGAADNPVNYAAISPDGRSIAFTDGSGIHVKVIETGEARTVLLPGGYNNRFRSSSAAIRFPVSWYPDGTRLLVSTAAPGSTTPGPVIWAVSLVNGNAKKVFEGAWASAISPDGSSIAAVKSNSEIWLMGPYGEEPHQFAAADGGNEIGRVIWSPDSRRLAYLRVIDKPGRLECALETRSIVDPRPVIALSDTRVCYSQAQSPWWLPDGRIIFSFAEPNFNHREFNLWEIKVDAQNGKPIGHPERLTNWPGFSLQGVTGSSDGKRVAFLRAWFHTTTMIGDIDSSHPGMFAHPRRMANEMEGEWPTAWTDDSRAVVFYSVKSGDTDIFQQPLDTESPNPVVTGPGEQLSAVLSPDGLWFIYMDVPRFQSFGLPNPVRLMKVPVSGGAPQLVLTSDGYRGHACSRRPSNVCVISEQSPDGRVTLSTFEPTGNGAYHGRGSKLLDLEEGTDWAVSPDGSILALSKVDDHQIQLRFVSLRGTTKSVINVKGWTKIASIHWAPDGRSLFITSCSPGACSLLQVDLQGVAHLISQQPGAFQMWAVPSPDDRHLAVFSASVSSDVWIAENF
jgi:DNA-binding winged helix-turn-helix (wHTH) protein/Tol biopolymer transport system component